MTWKLPDTARPQPDEFSFDLERAMGAVVSLRANVPEDAFTASILGTERIGNGILISDDLILTIGYLITEAESIWLRANNGRVASGHVAAYDQTTGFGLVRTHGSLKAPTLEIGSTGASPAGGQVVVIGSGGRAHSVKARILAKREFAGYWEYVLDEAIFTAPAHPNWGGAAMIGMDGKLQGVGSLYLEELHAGDYDIGGNMIVPIDLLRPILPDLLALGHRPGPARPWLGVYAVGQDETVTIAGLARNGPAYKADVRVGDVVAAVGDAAVDDLANTFRRVWAEGPAGTEIPLTLIRDGAKIQVRVRSIDRNAFLKQPRRH